MERVFVSVGTERIGVESVRSLVSQGACGAEVVFVGTVRENNEGRSVRGVLYDCARSLVVIEMEKIASEALPLLGTSGNVAMVHRVGLLAVGEVSVVIAVSAAHRAEAYEASRYIIEELKRRVPIWKQEQYLDGNSEWLGGHELQP